MYIDKKSKLNIIILLTLILSTFTLSLITMGSGIKEIKKNKKEITSVIRGINVLTLSSERIYSLDDSIASKSPGKMSHDELNADINQIMAYRNGFARLDMNKRIKIDSLISEKLKNVDSLYLSDDNCKDQYLIKSIKINSEIRKILKDDLHDTLRSYNTELNNLHQKIYLSFIRYIVSGVALILISTFLVSFLLKDISKISFITNGLRSTIKFLINYRK